jgi:predicted negative regulator of RcsB-dependent stress response
LKLALELEASLAEHISRKELKQDRIHDAFEHSAEAVYSHKQTALIVILAVLVVALGYAGWTVYKERQTAAASGALDTAMKIYNGRVASSPDPAEPGEVTYPDETARSTAAAPKFIEVADKYPNTNPGRLARYYAALCLEDEGQFNQAQENLKKISAGGDKELASMAQYQSAVIYGRTGNTQEAAKILRALADKSSVFVPRPLVLLELGDILRQSDPKGAAVVYQQIKKEFPGSSVADQADRGLETIAPSS